MNSGVCAVSMRLHVLYQPNPRYTRRVAGILFHLGVPLIHVVENKWHSNKNEDEHDPECGVCKHRFGGSGGD